jgi:cellulose synthase/poly-beta-1,6-N-acetylglucosamine synthase-like glycosyltransferase
MVSFALIVNYIAWYVFIFIGVVWILILLNRDNSFRPEHKSGKHYSVSVLIPAYNEEKTIAQTLQSVLAINYPTNLLEVIVINDRSTDNTPAILRKFEKQGLIRILTNKENRGKAYSLNRAIGVAKGELVACIDADSGVDKDILKRMIPHFDNPRIGSVTPALKIWKVQDFLEKIQAAEYILNVFLRKALAFLDSIHVTPGVFSVYRKSVLQEVGGFEEKNLTEDMDIALKIHEAGYKIENELGAVSYTMCPNTWKELFKQRIRWYRGAIQNSIKHKHMFFSYRYGNLGIFFLPLNFIAILAIFMVFMTVLWNYGGTVTDIMWKFSLVNWDMGVYLAGFNVVAFLANMISTPLILGLMGLVMGGYILYTSFLITEEKVKSNKKGYAIYLVIFPFIMMAFWTLAILHEVLRIERKW